MPFKNVWMSITYQEINNVKIAHPAIDLTIIIYTLIIDYVSN